MLEKVWKGENLGLSLGSVNLAIVWFTSNTAAG